MPDTTTLAMFAAASLALLIVPGPTLMYIVARGIQQGRGAALVSALGVELGTLLHLLVAVIGLSTLLASSERAFMLLKWLGAAYLLWLAVAAIQEQSTEASAADQAARMRSVFVQGVLVEALNPGTAFFFLAFLPQFADSSGGSWQFLLFGLIFVVLALCNDALFALLAGSLGARLRASRRFLCLRGTLCGCVYCWLAAFAVFAP